MILYDYQVCSLYKELKVLDYKSSFAFSEESNSKQKKRFNLKLSLIDKPSSETDLENEIKVERGEKESFPLENEQFQMSVDKKVHAKYILEEELNRKSTRYSAKQNQLELEQDNDKTTNSTVQANTEKFLQECHELDFGKTTSLTQKVDKNKLIQELNTERAETEKLRQQLSSKKTLNITLQTKSTKLRQRLYCEETRNKILYANNKKLKQRLECEQITIQNLLRSEDQEYEDWEKADAGKSCC